MEEKKRARFAETREHSQVSWADDASDSESKHPNLPPERPSLLQATKSFAPSATITLSASTLESNSAQESGFRNKHDGKVVTLADGFKSNVTNTNSILSRGSRNLSVVGTERQLRQALLVKEKEARGQELTGSLWLAILNCIAALKVMAYYLITLETFLTAAITVGLTVFWYYDKEEDESWSASSMDWILLGFAVVMPLSVSIGLAFRRREFALVALANFRSFSFQVYMAHSVWNWGANDGRSLTDDKVDWLDHSDRVLHELVAIGKELHRFLTLPTTSRIRHRLTSSGRKEAAQMMEVSYALFESMSTRRFVELSFLAEVLKGAGLSTSEVSRIRQYERFIGDNIENLRVIKMYRTPQALLAFARLFTLFLPPFYAPTFAQLGLDMGSLGVGICFALFAIIGLSALYESIQVLEDPFVAYVMLDGIGTFFCTMIFCFYHLSHAHCTYPYFPDVEQELSVLHSFQLEKARSLIFPDVDPYDDELMDKQIPCRPTELP